VSGLGLAAEIIHHSIRDFTYYKPCYFKSIRILL